MPARQTRKGFSFGWGQGENGWKAGHDQTIQNLQYLVQGTVIRSDTFTPPPSPSEGDVYAIPSASTPTGAWAGREGHLAGWDGAAWDFILPERGWKFFDASLGVDIEFDGTNFVEATEKPKAHTHIITEVTGLRGELDALDDKIDDEIADRASAVSAESAARIAADNALDARVDVLEAVASQSVSPFEHGAVGDGVADDSAAVTAANATGLPLSMEGGPFHVVGVTITSPIVDTYSRIFSDTSTATINNGQPVRPEWWGTTAGAIKRATESLPAAGGIVALRPIRYAYSGYGSINPGVPATPTDAEMLRKANIRFQGSKVPNKEGNILANGTVIEGPFGVWANNFSIDKVGIDSGPDVCAALYSNNPQDGFQATYTSTETIGSGDKTNLKIGDIICLCQSATAPVHACLIERYSGVEAGKIETFWGFHGLAVKSKGVRILEHVGTLHGGDGEIYKSDGAAQGNMAACQVVDVLKASLNACATHAVIIQAGGSAPLSSVRIRELLVQDTTGAGYSSAIHFLDEGGSAIIDDIRIDNINANGGQYLTSQNINEIDIRRFSMGDVKVSNMSLAGIQLSILNGGHPVEVDVLRIDNVRRPVDIYGNTIVRIGSVIEPVAHASETEVIRCNNNSYCGVSAYQTVTRLNPSSSFAFQSTWGQWPGGTVNECGVDMYGNKNRLRGLMRPNGSVATHFATIAREFRPAKEIFCTVLYTDATTAGVLQLLIKPDGTLNLSSVPAGLVYVSLEGVEWA